MSTNQLSPTERFDGRAEYYAKSRPGYPSEVIDILNTEISFKKTWIIADVGSGTGLLTKLFLDNGNEVYGVEPNADMRAQSINYLSDYSNFHSICGKAEKTTLGDASIDMVTVGQAFHWFETNSTKTEFKRILKPGGSVVVLLYIQDKESTPIHKQYESIIHKYGKNFAKTIELNADLFDSFFGTHNYKKFELKTRSEKKFDFNGLLVRLLSASYMPKKGGLGYPELLKSVKTAFERFQIDGFVTVNYKVMMWLGKF